MPEGERTYVALPSALGGISNFAFRDCRLHRQTPAWASATPVRAGAIPSTQLADLGVRQTLTALRMLLALWWRQANRPQFGANNKQENA
jgi:hypothetical protein